MNDLEKIATKLLTVRFNYRNEADLQTGIEAALAEEGIVLTREARLSAKDRIDFLTESGIGIEVKVDGSQTDVARQVGRYTRHENVRAVLIVTTCSRHTGIPDSFNGKPVRVLYLISSMF